MVRPFRNLPAWFGAWQNRDLELGNDEEETVWQIDRMVVCQSAARADNALPGDQYGRRPPALVIARPHSHVDGKTTAPPGAKISPLHDQGGSGGFSQWRRPGRRFGEAADYRPDLSPGAKRGPGHRLRRRDLNSYLSERGRAHSRHQGLQPRSATRQEQRRF